MYWNYTDVSENLIYVPITKTVLHYRHVYFNLTRPKMEIIPN